jgi:Mn-dependent DtxR family transcriptional regulator
MNRLHEKGWIGNPRSKSKSVLLTEEGQARARELFEKHFSQAE